MEKDTKQFGALRRRLAASEFIQALAAHMLHYIEDAAIRGRKEADVVHRHDAGMLEAREDAGFSEDARLLLFGRFGRAQHLERDVAIELAIVRQVNSAHTALADPPYDLVACAWTAGLRPLDDFA
jgi:hypothetical protein